MKIHFEEHRRRSWLLFVLRIILLIATCICLFYFVTTNVLKDKLATYIAVLGIEFKVDEKLHEYDLRYGKCSMSLQHLMSKYDNDYTGTIADIGDVTTPAEKQKAILIKAGDYRALMEDALRRFYE